MVPAPGPRTGARPRRRAGGRGRGRLADGHAAVLQERPCWGSLEDDALFALFRKTEPKVQEIAPGHDPLGDLGPRGQCRIQGLDDDRVQWQVEFAVHQLDGLRGQDDGRWPNEFLSPAMVPLGGGLNGMVSENRAWVALPPSCLGRPGEFDGPTVVDASVGNKDVELGGERGERDRTALARAVVRVANGTLRQLGCKDSLADPGKLPPVSRTTPTQMDALCGIKGLKAPDAERESLRRTRVTSGQGGPVRTCDLTHSGRPWSTSVRFMTVEDPQLAKIFSMAAMTGGPRIKGTKGYGTLTPSRAVYERTCRTGRAVFLVEQRQSDRGYTLPRELLPAYAESEAGRLGCGPVEMKMPAGS
ncbi:hypothetical protein [Streptomyces sp. MST-110588]|uniref:hypothetical protein n=1 Tax=Streptomyces sp. MST-110588 TaxID=2833628 RepID=UPI001F5C0FF0|nr:hypothetical protein [Streptomyces sp. MST-110588]UNO42357.1 hypothetical protein KGS77_26075 [Streptomyces sp. MST-110588]